MVPVAATLQVTRIARIRRLKHLGPLPATFCVNHHPHESCEICPFLGLCAAGVEMPVIGVTHHKSTNWADSCRAGFMRQTWDGARARGRCWETRRKRQAITSSQGGSRICFRRHSATMIGRQPEGCDHVGLFFPGTILAELELGFDSGRGDFKTHDVIEHAFPVGLA